jgi:tetratricopeptide (TPR) repeat protein
MKSNDNKPYKESLSKQVTGDTSTTPLSAPDIVQSSEYKSLLDELQKGHWEKCRHLIDSLDEKYPNNSKIDELRRYFEIKITTVHNQDFSVANEKKHNFRQLIIIITIIVGFLGFAVVGIWFGVKQSASNSEQLKLRQNQNQISSMSNQVEALLISGQTDKASEIIQKMKAIDAANPKVIELSQKTDEAIKLNLLYQDALAKLKNGLNSEALTVLAEIQKEDADYKNVPQLIEDTNNKIAEAQALDKGTKAYKQGLWQDAINNFEQVLTLDSSTTDLSFTDMLVNSYLQWITEMLESDNTTSSMIDQAQIYYRRAIVLIPQSQNYTSEREKFQQISTSLIGLNYTQIARTAILDPAQTPGSVSLAMVNLNKAVNLDPANTTLQAELNKTMLYQSGFQAYSEMQWPTAIKQLTTLIAIDEGFANGFAKQLLYESHINQGIQYESSGSFPEARSEFEAAESLFWNDQNLTNLYLSEVDLGRTLAEMKDYKDAASYFKFAVEKIDYTKRASASPAFVNDLLNAITLYTKGQYEDSTNLFVKTLSGDHSFLYVENEINVPVGEYLAIIAVQNQSSVQAILDRNSLLSQTLTSPGKTIYIQSLSN